MPQEGHELYRRLRMVATLLRRAPGGCGPRLLWTTETGAIKAAMLSGQALVIGRATICDVVLPDPKVSRRHCRVWRENGDCWVEDLGSTAGTSVGDSRIERRMLRDGDTLLVAGHLLVFLCD